MKPTVSESTTLPGLGQPDAPRGGVERGEQLVRLVGLGVGERVEQRGLAGVGVADQRHREHVAPHARAALHGPLLAQLSSLSRSTRTRLAM